MKIVHISDTHISDAHPARAEELAALVSFINAMGPRPDIVVHTGDVAHDGKAEEYRTARKLLDQLEAPYFAIPGNRDDRREFIGAFADGNNIRSGMPFVQYAVDFPNERLIFADTLSETSNKGRLCDVRLSQLETMLSAGVSRPTLLFLHHPPFKVDIIPDPHQFESWAEVEALERLLQGHPEVQGIFCGHVHRNIESSLGQIRVRTVSCVAKDLRKGKADLSRHELLTFRTRDFR